MNLRLRNLAGWTLIGVPFVFHSVYELAFKAFLKGTPEFLVDTACVSAVMTGVFLLVRWPQLRLAYRDKR